MERRGFLAVAIGAVVVPFVPLPKAPLALSEYDIDEFVQMTLANMKRKRWADMERALRRYEHGTT